MDEERKAQIRERAEAATPGPWKWKLYQSLGCYEHLISNASVVIEEAMWEDGYRGLYIEPDDAQFIAHARADIPDLLAALDAAEQRAAELEARLLAVLKLEWASDEFGTHCAWYGEGRKASNDSFTVLPQHSDDCPRQAAAKWLAENGG